MTVKGWVKSINRWLWSAEMMLHTTDGSKAPLLTGRALVAGIAGPGKMWLLTIREPLLIRHMYLMHSTIEGEWQWLMGKRVQLHLSVPLTEAELTAKHKTGEMVTVLVFASTVPFVFDGTARYLIFRRASDDWSRWERIGRLAMALEESEMEGYRTTVGMIAAMPV